MQIKSPSILLSQADSKDLVNLSAHFQLAVWAADQNRLVSLELDLGGTLPRLTDRKRNELSTRAVEAKIYHADTTRRRRQRLIKASYVDDLSLHGPSLKRSVKACYIQRPRQRTMRREEAHYTSE
jgi:hypothetical protein